jgi:hypothetical protein
MGEHAPNPTVTESTDDALDVIAAGGVVHVFGPGQRAAAAALLRMYRVAFVNAIVWRPLPASFEAARERLSPFRVVDAR